MDTVPRRRRSGPSGEPDLEDSANELAYAAALSQTGGGTAPRDMVQGGEASPGTLESGKAPGKGYGQEPLPTANPFHSDRVKSEVQLVRSRPLSLDEDGRRLQGDADDRATVVLEPDYSLAFGGAEGSGPRVARVDTGGEELSGLGGAAFAGAPPSAENLSGSLSRPELKVAPPPSEGGEKLEGRADATVVDEELVPDQGSATGFETLLVQVMAENQALKRRLEQLEMRSHSSWHSGTPGDGLTTGFSPVSFMAPEGLRAPDLGAGLSSAGNVQLASAEPAWFPNFPVPGTGDVTSVGGLELLKLCCAIGAWEVWKLCVRNCRRKTAAVDCGAQTSD